MSRLLALCASAFACAVLAAFALVAVPGEARAQSCPNSCSGNGLCFDGTCLCGEGWSGPDCSVPDTPEPQACPDDCSGHGTCDAGVCQCDEPWEGESCAERRRAAVGELTGVWRVRRARCAEFDVAEGRLRRSFLGRRPLEMTDALVTQRGGELDVFFDGFHFSGHAYRLRLRASLAAAAQCTETPTSPVAFMQVDRVRTDRRRFGEGMMQATVTHADGARYRTCRLWLGRLTALDPGVPACPFRSEPGDLADGGGGTVD